MAQATIEVELSEIVTRKADDRGRVRLGTDLADKKVAVAVIDASDEDEDEDTSS